MSGSENLNAATVTEPVAPGSYLATEISRIRAVTIFDLDRTITIRGTYSPFLLFAAWHRARWRLALLPCVIGAMIGYRLGFFDRKRLKEIMQRLMIGQSLGQPIIAKLAEKYADYTMTRNLHFGVLDLIAGEQTEGRLVMLATAAHRFYAVPIARRLGIREVVATDSRLFGGYVFAGIAGENCYGNAKAAAIGARLAELKIDRADVSLRCFSDDYSDLPCFEMSNEPIAVNPSRKLKRHAHVRGWKIINFC